MANKISVLIDVVTDKAVGGLKGFKQSVNDADGAVGKMKVAATGAFDQIKAHAGAMALAAGASLVAFGVKAVGAFNDLALEAGRFSEVTGLAVEDASRWIEVGTSIGVSAGTMETAFGKMNVEIGKGGAALKEFGIDVVLAKDGTVDANATFLNAIETIKGIQDPTKQAQAAQAAFGRGWKEMAELINLGADDIVTKMGEVSDAQVIDQAELGKAREMRESMDKLKDSIGDVALTVGEELTPAVSVAAEMLAGIAPIAGDMAGFVGDQFVKIAEEAYEFGQTLGDIADLIPGVNMAEPIAETLFEQEKLERGTADLVAEFAVGKPTMDEFVASLREQDLSAHAVNLAIIAYREQLTPTEGAVDDLTTATDDATVAVDDLTESAGYGTLAQEEHATATDNAKLATDAKKRADEEAEDAARAHTEAINDQIEALTGLVGGDIAVRDAQREAAAAVAELTVAMDAGELSAAELAVQQDAVATELIDAAAAAADYDEKVGNAAGKTLDAAGKQDLLRGKLEEVASTLAPGSALRQQIQGYIDDLNRIPGEVNTTVRATGGGSTVGLLPQIGGPRASGGPVAAGSAYVVGERGPEVFVPSASGSIIPNGNGNGNGNGHGAAAFNLTVNAGWGANGQDIGELIVAEIRKWERRNGQRG